MSGHEVELFVSAKLVPSASDDVVEVVLQPLEFMAEKCYNTDV